MVHHRSTFGDEAVSSRLCSQGQEGEVNGGLGLVARLPMEFWQLKILMGIASEVKKSVALDDFMIQYRKMGFARLMMEIDSSEPLKLGISING